jgi:hypothetical protein
MRYYSKRELYALGETLGDSVTEHKVGGGRIYGGGGKGGGGGTQQSTGTTYTTNIPEYARPYVETMLGATQKQLFDMEGDEITGFKPYQPYSTDPSKYIAGFQPLQETAMRSVGQMQTPGQFGQASGLAGMAGLGSLGAAQQAMGAGQQFQNMATDPRAMQGYMSPYMQNVVDFQKSQALRDFQIGQPMRRAQAVGQGAFGGSRQAIMEAEAERSLGSQLQGITAAGSQKAFEDAQRQQQFGAQLGMQGLQTGLQGFGQMGQAASTLGGLGSQQLGAQKDIIGMQSQFGREQQALEQQKINQAIQDFANAQQYPLMQLGVMSNMLRGLPMQSQTTNQYVAAPNAITQGIGLAGAGASIFNAMKKEGGVIKEMASGGITSYRNGGDVEGAIESQLYDMQPDDLTRYIKETSSPSVKRMAQRILKEKSMAGGGIIAFQNRGEVEDPDMVRQAYIDAAIAERPTFDTSVVPKAEPRVPLTERLGRALGIKDAGRQVPTRETTAMPLQASGSDVPMVARSPELAAAERAPVNPASIVAATPTPAAAPVVPKPEAKPETKKESKAEPKAAPKVEPKAAPAAAGTGIKATPSDKIMPTAGIKLPDTGVPGLQMPVAPVNPDAGKTTAQIAAEKEAYMGPNAGAQEARAKLMSERANATDEARRISALRMAEFFGAWGSTPGNTIVAGLNTLKTKVPDLIGDMKEATKVRRQIDKDISEIEKIERLEKSGNYDEAAKRKAQLGKDALTKYGYDIKAYSDAQQTAAYREVGTAKAAATGAGGEGKTGTLYNQAVTRLQTETKNIETAKKENKEYRRALIKLNSDPKNAEALAVKNAMEAGWNARLKERQDDVDYYKNKQGREARESGDSGESSAGKVKTYNPTTGKVE